MVGVVGFMLVFLGFGFVGLMFHYGLSLGDSRAALWLVAGFAVYVMALSMYEDDCFGLLSLAAAYAIMAAFCVSAAALDWEDDGE